jgi:hypothetical protein
MATPLRIATFNLENFDDPGPGGLPTLATRVALMRPQLERLRADVLLLQEVNSQIMNGVRPLRPGSTPGRHAARDIQSGDDHGGRWHDAARRAELASCLASPSRHIDRSNMTSRPVRPIGA